MSLSDGMYKMAALIQNLFKLSAIETVPLKAATHQTDFKKVEAT